MQEMLEFGQSQGRSANAIGGSSVVFDDGGQAWGSLWIKLTYMLLSPFPWMSGSLALQLGKIETMLWYYLLYVAIRGARRLWHSDRTMLMIIISFVVPSIIIYSTTVANIGLIFRQRIPIMMIVSLLSAVAWSKAPRAGQPSPPRRRQGEPAGHP
jgi:hypothetical protein